MVKLCLFLSGGCGIHREEEITHVGGNHASRAGWGTRVGEGPSRGGAHGRGGDGRGFRGGMGALESRDWIDLELVKKLVLVLVEKMAYARNATKARGFRSRIGGARRIVKTRSRRDEVERAFWWYILGGGEA